MARTTNLLCKEKVIIMKIVKMAGVLFFIFCVISNTSKASMWSEIIEWVNQFKKNKNEEIDSLKNRIKYLEKITSINTPIKTIKVPKYKHRSMNIYMEEGNVNEAWKLHKGQYRLYRTYPNKFIENDSCIIYKRPDGTNKYYGLIKMHEWIMETADFAILS